MHIQCCSIQLSALMETLRTGPVQYGHYERCLPAEHLIQGYSDRGTGSLIPNSSLGAGLSWRPTPQPGWQASLHGLRAETRHSLVKMWVHRRFRLLLLTIWILNTGFSNSASPSERILWSSENANGQSLGKKSLREALLNFFFPTTCIPKENQVVKACNKLQDYNKIECLEYKCCYSSFRTNNFSCFAPLKDKPAQMFRMFGLGVISMIILGCLPIYCCSFCRRSIIFPLRRTQTIQRRGDCPSHLSLMEHFRTKISCHFCHVYFQI
ncbi:fragile X mental retardation 1 neighbor protein [Eumetopias jubatus]|uniref:fragile X mental retardation 1 neighbor protein n=1 Tax=Eumetopias jubatus TaxID=34886 RepID=UPI0010169AB0|nr:fragile X mental retardation 1 neighbor protein [Eumetopias jubatus]